MTGTARAGAAGQWRAVFAVDEEAALAALQEAWADGGYHAFGVEDEFWSAISSAGEVLTGSTPDELTRTSGPTGRRCSDAAQPCSDVPGTGRRGPGCAARSVLRCAPRCARLAARRPPSGPG